MLAEQVPASIGIKAEANSSGRSIKTIEFIRFQELSSSLYALYTPNREGTTRVKNIRNPRVVERGCGTLLTRLNISGNR